MALRNLKSAAVRTAALFLVSFWLSACNNAVKPVFLSTDITGANFGVDFNLADHSGSVRTLGDFKGKAVVIFFGYTNCPDACPATMANLAAAMRKLGDDAKRVQVLFVTIDPEHDTPELLYQYVSSFDPAFLGLWGDIETTKKNCCRVQNVLSEANGGNARASERRTFNGHLYLRYHRTPAALRDE